MIRTRTLLVSFPNLTACLVPTAPGWLPTATGLLPGSPSNKIKIFPNRYDFCALGKLPSGIYAVKRTLS